MKKITLFIFTVIFMSCSSLPKFAKVDVDQTLDNWHQAASEAKFDNYFDLMTTDAVFIGTDATENWNVTEFKAYSKPYFDKGKAWSFTPIERNVFKQNEIYYFDELLNTQMGICRGSGVLKIENGRLKIAHYVLSIAIPNEDSGKIIEIKKSWDNKFIETFKRKSDSK